MQVTISCQVQEVSTLEELCRLLAPKHGAQQVAAAAQAPDPTVSSSSNSDYGGFSMAGVQPGTTSALETQVIQQVLPQTGGDLEEATSLVQQYKQKLQHSHLHLFTSPSYAEGVSIHTADGRHSLVPRVAADSGCLPSIMSGKYAASVGISVTALTAEERARVRSIDGTSAERIRGRTQPLSVKLQQDPRGRWSSKLPRAS